MAIRCSHTGGSIFINFLASSDSVCRYDDAVGSHRVLPEQCMQTFPLVIACRSLSAVMSELLANNSWTAASQDVGYESNLTSLSLSCTITLLAAPFSS